jgi:putative transposase
MSVRDIIYHLRQVYGTELSPETVSRITDQVLEEVRAWQSRPLDPATRADDGLRGAPLGAP